VRCWGNYYINVKNNSFGRRVRNKLCQKYLNGFDVFHGRLEEGEFALNQAPRGATQADHQGDGGDDDGLDGLQLDQSQEDGHQLDQLNSTHEQQTNQQGLQLQLLLLFETSCKQKMQMIRSLKIKQFF